MRSIFASPVHLRGQTHKTSIVSCSVVQSPAKAPRQAANRKKKARATEGPAAVPPRSPFYAPSTPAPPLIEARYPGPCAWIHFQTATPMRNHELVAHLPCPACVKIFSGETRQTRGDCCERPKKRPRLSIQPCRKGKKSRGKSNMYTAAAFVQRYRNIG
jgi:hypothetical protein